MADSAVARFPPLVRSLCERSLYDHPVNDIQVLETHISYVILTGPYAYKLKKPVQLPFLDFSSVELRRFYCKEELRLNQRLAPDLYLAVVPVTGSDRAPQLSGSGDVIDYLVKMIQFDTSQELDAVLRHSDLDRGLVLTLAERLAAFHQSVDSSTDQDFGSHQIVGRCIRDNFKAILPCVKSNNRDKVSPLRQWVDAQLRAHRNTIARRKQDGFVRECHGDLHLGNMVIIGGSIRMFDCLEFNAHLRWIDVISEIAFLVMDFDHQRRSDLGYLLLNRYLQVTGDYAGLEMLPLYLVYRAMVRAKVVCIKSLQSMDRSATPPSLLAYFELAQGYTRLPPPRLFITHGVSGSGKSWLSERVTALLPAIHIRSDIERRRSASLTADESMDDSSVRYDTENVELIYDELWRLAQVILSAGFTVVVDATFLLAARRERFRQLAVNMKASFRILDFQCAQTVLYERVAKRKREGKDPSEATVEVLNKQLQHAQALSTAEQKDSISIHSDEEIDVSALAKRILRSVA